MYIYNFRLCFRDLKHLLAVEFRAFFLPFFVKTKRCARGDETFFPSNTCIERKTIEVTIFQSSTPSSTFQSQSRKIGAIRSSRDEEKSRTLLWDRFIITSELCVTDVDVKNVKLISDRTAQMSNILIFEFTVRAFYNFRAMT